ncbi:MAG: hypothetical protein DI533_03890 [Cereibacter sphaeroides]|uniref:Tetratricopeptide repeat-like domain-containing protein n=1 Tax=Cereibacter sphaeroides TaxID=1063 RepID=A0A2W5SD18_CERSP|nr:MAG: hypothetical protein DI533_03890 [Cereibacter sphaeroides]
MSNPESFIDEVTEEVRRDKLFGYFRRYGWIAILAVLLIVGGAAAREYRMAQFQSQSKAFGDALMTALDMNDAAARRVALSEIEAPGQRGAILGLLLASDPSSDRSAALAALEKVAADTTLPPSYKDLAVLRRVILAGSEISAADRKALLDPIAVAGRPYRVLAQEQLAMLLAEGGDNAGAIAALEALRQDQEATPALRSRVEQVIVALGGTPATN